MRKKALILILVTITLMIVIIWFPRRSEGPRAVFLIVVDTLRPDRLSCYGYQDNKTPSIDRLARSGTVFKNAQASSSWTTPSVASILTSQLPSQLGLVETPADSPLEWREPRAQLSHTIPRTARTLPALLAEEGFHAAAFINQPLLVAEEGFTQGFEEWFIPLGSEGIRRHDRETVMSTFPGSSTWKNQAGVDSKLVDIFEEWLNQHSGERIFAWLHLLSPHTPYNPPRQYRIRGSRDPSVLYDAEVRHIDAMMGRVLRAIESSVGWDNSVVVFTSDHGEEFGERGMNGHGHSLHRELIWVPLIIAGTPFPRGETVSAYVRTTDIMPTLLELVGAPSLASDGVAGTSLLPLLDTDRDDRIVYSEGVSHGSTKRTLIQGGYKLMYDEKGPQYRLYDVRSDPTELRDLADEQPKRTTDMRKTLQEMYKRFEADRYARLQTVTDSPENSDGADTGVQLLIEHDKVLVIKHRGWKGNTWRYRLPEYLSSSQPNQSYFRPNPATGKKGGAIVLSGSVYERGAQSAHGSYRIVATAHRDVVDLEAQVTNVGSKTWDPTATLCFQNISALDFCDFEGSRTWIMVGGTFMPVAMTSHGQLSNDSLSLHHAHLLRQRDFDRISENIRHYFDGSEIVSSSLIVRSAKDGRRHVAVAWEDSRHVSYNLNQSFNCIHSEPRFDILNPRKSQTIRGRIYFVEGSLDDVYQRFENDFPKLGFGNRSR